MSNGVRTLPPSTWSGSSGSKVLPEEPFRNLAWEKKDTGGDAFLDLLFSTAGKNLSVSYRYSTHRNHDIIAGDRVFYKSVRDIIGFVFKFHTLFTHSLVVP